MRRETARTLWKANPNEQTVAFVQALGANLVFIWGRITAALNRAVPQTCNLK